MAAEITDGRFPPHLRPPEAGIGLPWAATFCLLPAAAWGAVAFGMPALIVLAISVGASCIAELALTVPRGRCTLGDGTAFLTGLLIGCSMPPAVALYVPAAASAFAILVVKHTFGGAGRNWMNPAMAGRTFALLCWPVPQAAWTAPFSHADAVGSATPLAVLRGLPLGASPWAAAASGGMPVSVVDAGVTAWVRRCLGIRLPDGIVDLLLGWRPGAIGEVSMVLLAAGAAVLIYRRIIRWEIPAAFLATFALLSWILGGPAGTLFRGAPLYAVASGGIVLCAFFSATDPVTSPMSRSGRVLFAVGVGGLSFLLRRYGSTTEGTGAALILMNCLVPLLDRWIRPQPFGSSRRNAA